MSGILLDTNVLSELMRAQPATAVLQWFDRHSQESFFVSAVTQAEILLGIALLPDGKRRQGLAEAAERMFATEFSGCCLTFDEGCAAEYALLVSARVRSGQAISTEDGQIAATCRRHGLRLATRNVKDFHNIHGLEVINPWS